ncbi:hypothetical protein EWM64_g1046 [Hericium alpestre]|uniref:DNA mismatch repair proteins mutS family domain-containing protein n=1 Tax=Hericium alpestre TaxID=135208 RepID=A0A4Z0A881_9AGAM|nr:hypothetical protein EWM64_g1046 [Hericium alpestre]
MSGCFVPAEYASFHIHDTLLTRLSNDDDMEKSLSTFANEMASCAMILGLATSESLVLVDELGRGTSPDEGVGIAHAIAGELIKRKCFVFFATHFHELSTTLSRQPTIVNLHLSTQRTRSSSSNCGITFQYKIVDGALGDLDHYGLELARLADLPSDALVESRKIATHLASLKAQRHEESASSRIAARRKILLRLQTQITQASEHASFSSVFHCNLTGTIILRLLHNGLILELVSLSTETTPIRFVLPAAILSNPAILLWNARELHILAVTSTGSLYRIVLPLQSPAQLWSEHLGRNWCREYQIKHTQDTLRGMVQVQGAHCVAVALESGQLLRLDAEFIGDESSDDQWIESNFQHTSFLTSIASFLPLHQHPAEGSQTVAIASHPQPTDVPHVWTLSRDRTLRLWAARSGCTSARTLPTTFSAAREMTPSPGSTPAPKVNVYLDPEPQKLLAVFTVETHPEEAYVLAFIPTPSSSSAGGFFQLFGSANDSLRMIESFESSAESAHCHLQDFSVANGRVITLWDRQGRSAIESMDLLSLAAEGDLVGPMRWRSATYPHEPELTPAYLDELLLAPGSLTEKFFAAVMRPGIFSSLTLRTAIEQYTDACLSIPGPRPPQLNATYQSLAENIAAVVGCTVTLVKDPQTGALQHERYWISLKRDWEGFIARCREVERSARWPLVLGICDAAGSDVVVVERERVGSLVAEDLPLRLCKTLRESSDVETQFSLCEIAWTLRSKLGARLVRALEARIVDVVHQEIAFPFADIIHDQAQRSLFKDELDEGLESWISGRLQSIEDIDAETRLTLDLIGGFDKDVKREEDEVELLIPQQASHWTRLLTASYINFSVEARYEFIVCLVILLFFLSEDLPQWDPALLAEVFAVFRGVAMLRYATEQPVPAGIASEHTTGRGSLDPDDVVLRLRNLNIARTPRPSVSTPAPSLLDLLLSQAGNTKAPLPSAAHAFLDGTGLLQATSPAHAAKLEVLWCERFRTLGLFEVAREMLEWLPRTPGVMYVRARLWLDIGREADAVGAFENLAGSFGPHSALSQEDAEALAAVLPGGHLSDSDFGFYMHVSALFKAAGLTDSEVRFARLALSVAPPDWDTTELWFTIIKGSIELGYYDDAYVALMTTPHDKLRRECVRQFVYRICEEQAVQKLISFNFVGLADEVEECLSFKARNADPRERPSYSRILYTWYITRGDYRNAALVMYQRARKLSVLSNDPAQFAYISEQTLESYTIAINALRLLDQKNPWIVLPMSAETGHPRKRRKLTRNIPEDNFSNERRDSEIVELNDIVEEYTLLLARIELIRRDPSLLHVGDVLLQPESVVLRLGQASRFDMALSTAHTLNVDATDVFSHLTRQCLRLTRNPDAVLSEDTSDWLLTDKATSWPGTPADRGWRYLRQALERYDSQATDFKYTKAVFQTVLGYDRSSMPPPWLVRSLEEHHSEWLIRTCLRYEMFEMALEQTKAMIRAADARLAQYPPKTSMATWLPYTLIDQLLVATAEESLSTKAQSLRKEVHSEVLSRTRKMEKMTEALGVPRMGGDAIMVL